MSRLDQNWTRN